MEVIVMGHAFAFFVPGTAKPKGSVRVFMNRKTGKAQRVTDSDAAIDWGARVTEYAIRHRPCLAPVFAKDVPVQVDLTFHRQRIKGHYSTRKRDHGQLLDSAPIYATTPPDADKLIRTILDALTHAGLWVDDAQAAVGGWFSVFADTPGVMIGVRVAPGPHTVGERRLQVPLTKADVMHALQVEEDTFG
jgi:Holliday junction resolvase